jgi:Mce-associated membrane protein
MALTLAVALSPGLIGFGGWTMWRHHEVAAEQHARAEFAAGAQQGMVNLMSLDYQHAKEDVQRIIDGAAGDFKKDFQATAEDFIKVAQSSKSVTTATVTATAVSAMTQDTATVLVAATTKVSNVAGKDQPPRAWRLNVDVVRDGGQIKLAKVEFVP